MIIRAALQYRNQNQESQFQIEYRNREMKMATNWKFDTPKVYKISRFST